MSNDTQPEIRFPGFTEAWEQRKLGEFVTIRSGWSPSNFEEANDKGSLFVKVDDLNSSTRVQNNSNMKVIENPKYDKMKQGSTIFPKRGAAIMTNKVRILGENGYMDTNMMALEPSGIVGEFLYTFISRTGLYKIADTSTIPQINNKHIEPYEISLPEIKEQQKIGIFFKQLDDTITLHQSKLDLLKETKKGFLQKMFPKNGAKVPEIRFPGFTEAWELCKLGRIFDVHTDFVSNGSFQSLKNNVRFYNDENYAYMIRLQDASNNWRGPWLYTDKHGFDFLKKSTVYENDILMSDRGTIGKFFLVPKLDRPMTLSSNAVLLRSSNCNNNFIYYMLNTIDIGNQIKKRTTPGVQPMISKTEFKKIITKLPVKEEQKKIGNFFKQLDDTITLHQRKLDLLKEMKKGFLQKMFV